MSATTIAKHDCGFRTTHNGDGSSQRCWKLLSDGTLLRTNTKSRYQPWIAGETIPAEILAAAKEHGIEIQPGRPAVTISALLGHVDLSMLSRVYGHIHESASVLKDAARDANR